MLLLFLLDLWFQIHDSWCLFHSIGSLAECDWMRLRFYKSCVSWKITRLKFSIGSFGLLGFQVAIIIPCDCHSLESFPVIAISMPFSDFTVFLTEFLLVWSWSFIASISSPESRRFTAAGSLSGINFRNNPIKLMRSGFLHLVLFMSLVSLNIRGESTFNVSSCFNLFSILCFF